VCKVFNKAFLPPPSTRLLCLVVSIPLVCWLYMCACVCVKQCQLCTAGKFSTTFVVISGQTCSRCGLWKFAQTSGNPLHTNIVYSQCWYAFPLFLTKFHSVNPFNCNFCDPRRARFDEEKNGISISVVSKMYSMLFSAKFGPFSSPFRGRAGCTCWMNLFMTWLV